MERGIVKTSRSPSKKSPNRISYRILSHTADLGMEVKGKDLPDLFVQAGRAFFDLMIGLVHIELREEKRILVSAPDQEALLVAWLSELLFLFETRGLVFGDFQMLALTPDTLEALGRGERFKPGKHPLRQVFKAVTYHQLRIQETKGGWKARVIFDV